MNRKPTNISTQPVTGRCAFVRGAAMLLTGDCGGYAHAMHLAALKRPEWSLQIDGRVVPGEGSA